MGKRKVRRTLPDVLVGKQLVGEPGELPITPQYRQGRRPKLAEPRGPDPSKLPPAEPLKFVPSDSPEYLGREIALFDFEAGEESIYPHLPEPWQDAIRAMTNEYWQCSYPELIRKVNPTPIDLKLRRRIWHAYDVFKKTGTEISFSEIARDVCSRKYLYEVAERPWKLRFYIEPVKEYGEAITDLLDIGLARLHEIIMMPVTNWRGAYDPLLIEKIIKVVVTADHRKHGSYTQRMEATHQITSASVNVNIDQPTSMEEIDSRLAELSEQLPAPPPRIIEAEPMSKILNSMSGTSADSKKDLETLEIRPRERGEPMDVWARTALKAKDE